MTPDEFRMLALELPEATEGSHMGVADFRVRNKIFATLGHAGEDSGMVKLTPDSQALFVRSEPGVFEPVKGGWGRRGCTTVWLSKASEPSVRQAQIEAWRNTAPKKLVKEFDQQ